MIPCPVCGEQIAAPVRACRWCRAPMRWYGPTAAQIEHPPLAGIVPIVTNELASQPIADEPRTAKKDGIAWSPSPYGSTIALAADRVYHFLYGAMRMRDTAVRVVFSAHDKLGTLGVVVRRERLDDHYTEYRCDVTPGAQTIGWKRVAGGKDGATAAELAPPRPFAAVAPPGARNELIVAAYGASLQAWINGQHALAFHDATYGIGVPGFALLSKGGATQMTVQVVEIGMIAGAAR